MRAFLLAFLVTGCGAVLGPFTGPPPQPTPPDPWGPDGTSETAKKPAQKPARAKPATHPAK